MKKKRKSDERERRVDQKEKKDSHYNFAVW